MPRSLILRLQNVQNNAARLILGISKHEHISIHLHWQPIDSRISNSNVHVFPTTVCVLIIWPTSLIVIHLTPLPVRFAHLLTVLSFVIGLFLQYPMATIFRVFRTFLLGTIFLNSSTILIAFLFSDLKLKLTFPTYILIP